ncbi:MULTISPECIES: hypothetical protein [unclassified Methylobacterium]|jgi:hypothetical protein|uniref:hypothetical protein n=1 Tax=unclassified Methylobacterium TaxID=2615210 RepID=UPI001354ADC3|nr:hypothetical protein [Methylobacterium sp. 2A]MWV21097.1 hypothetical protein [Methylobacterium sp. 2A]
MTSSATHSVLFFRAFREAALPILDSLVDELCGSPHLPFQLATTLEDIGQHFIRLAEQVNDTLDQRGLLGDEVDADLTVESRIDNLLMWMCDSGLPTLMNAAGPGAQPISMLKHEAVREAVRLALVMTQSLPVAVKPAPDPGQSMQT